MISTPCIKFRVILYGSAAILAAACSPASTVPTPTQTPAAVSSPSVVPAAAIQFATIGFDLGSTRWMEGQAQEYGVGFSPIGIYGLDQDTAFVYGGLRVAAGTIGSVLLRTDDGGQHWQEVMTPVAGSSVLFMDFVDGGHGWALAVWEVEGFGAMALHETTDYGVTWTELSDVPKWQWYGYPLEMSFSDNAHGQIDMMYDGGMPATNRIAYLTTQDGGVTWVETSSLPFDPSADDAYDTAFAPYVNDGASGVYQVLRSTGADGSEWELQQNSAIDRLLVSRHFESAEDTYLLPTHFDYAQLQSPVYLLIRQMQDYAANPGP